MAQQIDTDDVIRRIIKNTGLSRAEIVKRVEAKVAAFDGLLTTDGATGIVADDLHVPTCDPTPKAEPVLEAIMKNGAPELCQYCGNKKSWGIKVVTKNGKNAPGHITADGKPLITIVDGVSYTGECPHWIKGAEKPSATKGTIFEQKEPFYTTKPSAPNAVFDAAAGVIEYPIKVPPQEPMKVVPKAPTIEVDEDAMLAELLASEPPAPKTTPKVEAPPKTYPFVVTPCTDGALVEYECKECHATFEAYTSPSDVYCKGHAGLEIVDNARKANKTIEIETGIGTEVKAQPTTPNGTQPSPAAGVKPPTTGHGCTNPGNVVVAPPQVTDEHGYALVYLPEIKTALENQAMGFMALADAIKASNVLLTQQAVTNTAALAEAEDSIRKLRVDLDALMVIATAPISEKPVAKKAPAKKKEEKV